jgi:hypothetical protein
MAAVAALSGCDGQESEPTPSGAESPQAAASPDQAVIDELAPADEPLVAALSGTGPYTWRIPIEQSVRTNIVCEAAGTIEVSLTGFPDDAPTVEDCSQGIVHHGITLVAAPDQMVFQIGSRVGAWTIVVTEVDESEYFG